MVNNRRKVCFYRLTRTANGVEYKYIWVDGLLMSQTWGNEIMIFLYDEVGSPIGFGYRYGSGDSYDYYYYDKNLQGDIVGIFNQSGTRIVEYTYDAWGESQGMSGIGAYPLGFNNPFRYRGYYFDYETNLYYLQSRYYDPVNGRFLNADGEMSGVGGDLQGYNLYSYCFNDPVNFLDLYGNWPNWNKLLSATSLIATGVIAMSVAATVLTGGGATPLAVTAMAWATALMGAACLTVATGEIQEAFTGDNYVRDSAFFGGDQEKYEKGIDTLESATAIMTFATSTVNMITTYLRNTGQMAVKVKVSQMHGTPSDSFYTIGPKEGQVRMYYNELCRTGGFPSSKDPITVINSFNNTYQVLNGHHRFKALQMYGSKYFKVQFKIWPK